MMGPKPVLLTLSQFTSWVAPATVFAPLLCITPHPPGEVECISSVNKAGRWSQQRDAAARRIGRPVFLHVLLLNCDYISKKMFQIRKNSMNIFEIYKNISLFNIYIFQNI